MKLNRELEQIRDLAALTFGDASRAQQWLVTPLPVFNHKTPKELVAEGRFSDLLKYLDSMHMGFVG